MTTPTTADHRLDCDCPCRPRSTPDTAVPLDVEALLDEADAMIARDQALVPEDGWMTADQVRQRGSLQGQSAAIGWLRNRLRATPPTAEEEG